MGWKEDLGTWVDDHLNVKFEERDGRVVPTTDDVTNKQAVKLDATFLYADLAGSAQLAEFCPWDTTSKVIRAFLYTSTRLIKVYGGEIRSFDGDRVMGVFLGDMKNTYAVRCAREIFYTVENIIAPKATAKFNSISKNGIKIKCGVGIDTGTSRAVRGGIREHNDLIWIGRAPSLAAKLSDIRKYPFCVYVHGDVYSKLGDSEKMHDGTNIWEERSYALHGKTHRVYRTKFTRTP